MKHGVGIMLVLIVMVSVLAGCGSQGSGQISGKAVAEKPIKIGYIGPLSGDVAVLGLDASMAIKLAVEEANAKGGIGGRPVKLYIEDDQYKTAKTVTAYNKLVKTQGVDTIIVSTYGGLFAIANQSKKDGVLVVDSLDCDGQIADDLPENVFCVAKETNDLADVISKYAIEQGFKTVGILHGTVDQFMPSVADRFKQKAEAAGVKVNVEPYNPGTLDFKTPLLKIKDSDAIVYLGYDEIGLAIRQAEELRIKKPALTISSVATTPSIQTNSKGSIEGIHFSFYAPLESNKEATRFYKAFEAKHGRKPYVFVASDHAYDAANMLIEKVLPKASAATKEEQLKQKMNAMYAIKDYRGVSGTLDMGADGRIQGILIRLYQLKNMTPTYVQG